MYPEDNNDQDGYTYQEIPPRSGSNPEAEPAQSQDIPQGDPQSDYSQRQDSAQQDYSQQQGSAQQNYSQQQGSAQQDYRYQQSPYEPPTRSPKPVSGMSIAALILGILSIVLCCCGGIGGIIFGAVGIILAVLSRGEEGMQTNAKIGLGLSIAGLVLGFIITILVFVAVQGMHGSSATLYRFEDNSYFDDYQYSSPDRDMSDPYNNSLNDLFQEENQDF